MKRAGPVDAAGPRRYAACLPMTDLRRDISLFISVARIDETLHTDRHELHKIPQEIAVIDKAIADLEAREKAAQAALEKRRTSRRETERRLREHEDHLRKLKGQQSEVKTNEAYTAMLKEIATLEEEIGNEEERILVLMDEIEQAEKETRTATEALEAQRATRAAERQALEARQKEVAADVEKLEVEKPKLLSEITPLLLKRYERVDEKLKDRAVTRIDNDHCGVCGQQLPPQLAVEVRKSDQFISCPNCGRILVHYAD